MTPGKLIKRLAAATLILLLVWLGYLYTQIPHRQAPYVKAVSKADAIHLQRGAAKIDLQKSGSGWSVSNTPGTTYTADADKVKSLTEALKALQLDEEISERAEHAADFDVTPDSGLRVSVASGGHTLADGIFGKQAPDYTHLYFKFPDTPIVYLGRSVILGELGGVDLNDWRDHNLITLAETKIDGILIDKGSVKLTLQRSSSTWTMDGTPIDPAPVYGLVGLLAHLKADDFVNPASTPTVTFAQLNAVTVTVTAEKQTTVLHIGQEDKASKRYPVAISPQSLAWLAETKVQQLLPSASSFTPKK